MTNLFGLTLAELQDALAPYRVPAYRAGQIAAWLYQKGAASFDAMTNLSKALRAELSQSLVIQRPQVTDTLVSADGCTRKLLLEFADGVAVETVLMRQPYGNSICVSTQAGCNMGCAFCASTLKGLARDLTRGEILAQAIVLNDMLREAGEGKVDTVVIMGSGEPLMNYENVLGFIRLLHADYTLGMSYRSITLSTSGIVEGMKRLAGEGIPISLSVSLHAPNQALRERIMPIARRYPLEQVVAAARHYAEVTKRRVTYEYILIDGVTDGEEQARQLANLLHGQLASVNLIPINPVTERGFLRPSKERIERFERYLQSRHIAVTVRREMGADIQAACGQLRNRHLSKHL